MRWAGGGAARRAAFFAFCFAVYVTAGDTAHAAEDAAAHEGPHDVPHEEIVLDDFEDIEAWSTLKSEGTDVEISLSEGVNGGRALRVDFDLNTGHGFVILRRPIDLRLPRNYVFHFDVRGQAQPNDLEFKLVDTSAKNVWRRVFRDLEVGDDWQRMRARRSRFAFAWGPNPEIELDHVGAIEIALTAREGGRGTIFIDDLRLEPRAGAAPAPFAYRASASSSESGHEPSLVLDGAPHTSWHSTAETPAHWIALDLGTPHELGGLVLDWDGVDFAHIYEVQLSDDARTWTSAHRATRGNGGRDYIFLGDAEARHLRIVFEEDNGGRGVGVAEITLEPPGFGASMNAFFQEIAADSPPGAYPKYLLGRQTYWTVVGSPDHDREALVNEEGMVEVDTQTFSIEPFLNVDGELWTWSDVSIEQSLQDGYLPIPSVVWRREDLELAITAFAAGPSESSTLYLRYTLTNHADTQRNPRLFLAVRPFQVSPPWQALNMTGGVSTVHDIDFDGERVRINGDKTLICIVPPDGFGAMAFEEGSVGEHIRKDSLPAASSVGDAFGYASGLLRYDLVVEPNSSREIALAVPFHGTAEMPVVATPPAIALEEVDAKQRATADAWRVLLDRVGLRLPAGAEQLVRTLKSTLAYVLIHRDDAAIQPGSRVYARSWIRDGSLTSAALLQTGFPAEVREFLAWYAPLQFADGRVPCCVDRRGSDPTPEHDSHGEFIYGVAEYYRFTRDVGLVNDLWPRIVAAVEVMAELRGRRMTAEYEHPDKLAFYGLLPESISHEGYSSHPVHSYWDDFFALRGLKDAADLARVVGDEARMQQFAELRDDFRRTLYESIDRSMALHGIDYIPGSVELGDFDPTSTAIAIGAGSELGRIPFRPLRRTFERYTRHFRQRRTDAIAWDAYSAYEVRNVQALVKIGRRQRAAEVLAWLVADQRPTAWNQWPEISWRDRYAPRFIGDMPHTWIGSAFVSSLRTMLAYERELDQSLVVGAGVPREWVASGEAVEAKRLPTHYGVLSLKIASDDRAAGEKARVRVELRGDLRVPDGGIVVHSPFVRPLRGVLINGRESRDFDARTATVNEFPADVVLLY